MKIRQIQTETNQHVVALEQNGELRCYFENSSLHTCGAALQSLTRDIANHGDSVVDFASLPLVNSRVAKSGKTVFSVAK